MDGHIDWLSFTLKTGREPSSSHDLYLLSKALIREVSHEHESYLFDGQGFEQALSRAPYRLCLERDDRGLRVFGNSPTGTVLYELAGRACEGLRRHEDAVSFVAPLAHKLSRFDYAVDIRTGTKPADFQNERSHQRVRSISFIRSDTGETVYCGSPKSDRFARVYRFNPPHPRNHLLRVEFVFRRGLARIAAGDLCTVSSRSLFIAKLGNTFGFAHRDWQTGVETDERMRSLSISKNDQETVAWLYKQVAPAMRRLMNAGSFDITDFLEFVYTSGREAEVATGD